MDMSLSKLLEIVKEEKHKSLPTKCVVTLASALSPLARPAGPRDRVASPPACWPGLPWWALNVPSGLSLPGSELLPLVARGLIPSCFQMLLNNPECPRHRPTEGHYSGH